MSDNTLNRRDFLKLAGVGAAALAVPSWAHAAAAGAGRKPNIIVIIADDLGYAELSVQGCKDVPTPNVDSIAKNGVRFTNGYVSCPVCSPTRAGLNTGRYQQRFGHEFNPGMPGSADAKFGLPLTETFLAKRLKAAGYVTGAVGKWHLGYTKGYMPLERGYDEFFGFPGGAHGYIGEGGGEGNHMMRGNDPVDEKAYLTDAFGREAVSFIDRHKEKPFFLYLAFNAVHSPLQAIDKYLKRFSSIKDEKRRTFAAMQSAMDDAIGEVLTSLRKNKLENDTLVYFISDNGGPTASTTSSNVPLRGFKAQVYEGGIRTPAMVQWPGHIPAGKVYDKPVISLDIAPTALAAAGVTAKDAKFDGVNLLPFLKGDPGAPHETLFWRYGDQHAIRKGDWKLLRGPFGDDGLYNLADDIAESKDLSAEKPEKVKELQAIYDKWDSELVAPLWHKQPGPKQLAKGKGKNKAGGKNKQNAATGEE